MPTTTMYRLGPLAHREEQGTFNPQAPGSRPGRPTSSTKDFEKFSRIRTAQIPHSIPPMCWRSQESQNLMADIATTE